MCVCDLVLTLAVAFTWKSEPFSQEEPRAEATKHWELATLTKRGVAGSRGTPASVTYNGRPSNLVLYSTRNGANSFPGTARSHQSDVLASLSWFLGSVRDELQVKSRKCSVHSETWTRCRACVPLRVQRGPRSPPEGPHVFHTMKLCRRDDIAELQGGGGSGIVTDAMERV